MRSPRLPLARGHVLLTLFGSLLSLNCMGSSPVDQIPCGGVTDCRAVAVKPVCADSVTAICSVNMKCLYRMTNSYTCHCVAGEVQTCALGGSGGSGGQGVQNCVASGGQSADWGSCAALP